MRRFSPCAYALLLIAMLCAGACTPDVPEGIFACTQVTDCPNGWSCDRGYCYKPESASGDDDGGVEPDASEMDGGNNPPDAATPGGGDAGTDAGGDAGSCDPGFMPSADGCVDIDECKIDSASCDPLVKCTNTRGAFTCGKCPAGYSGSGIDGCIPQLTGLSANGGVLDPAFDADVDGYVIEVALGRQTVALTPSAPSGVTIEIEGDGVKSGKAWTSPLLALGSNKFTIALEQTGHASHEYTVDVVRGRHVDYLKASNADAQDLFGTSVAISGDTIVVGAWRESSAATGVNNTDPGQGDNSSESGAAYVFVRSGATWKQQAYLKAGNAQLNDQFGTSVAISGDTIVVGAPGEDSMSTGAQMTTTGAADDSATDSGAAYVFVRSGTTWKQQAYLKASNTGMGDAFGAAVAISGDTIAVGAPNEDGSGEDFPDSGTVYVYERSGSPATWSGPSQLTASTVVAGYHFGKAVAIDGDTLIAGEPNDASGATGVDDTVLGAGDASAPDSGAAFVFTHSAAAGWMRTSYIKASNTGSADQFGSAVAISGDTFVVGAPFEDSAAKGVDGEQNDDNANAAGAAYVFAFDSGSSQWSQQAYLKASNTESFDQFGAAVAISGDLIAVGAPDEGSASSGVEDDSPGLDDNSELTSGAVYLYVRNTTWAAPLYVKAINPGSGDFFGAAVALADDTLVCAAPSESSASRGVNSDDPGPENNSAELSGAVYVY